MYKDGDDADDLVTITVENTEIRCNRKKLSECSRYFDVLFNGNFLESHEKTVTIQDVKSSMFEAILSYVEDAHSVGKDDLLDVLEVACMLQFDNLREYCVERLTDSLSVATCLQVWQICERLNVQPLATKAKCKALLEFNAIKDTDNITSLSLEELHSYLASTSLHCENELDVFKCGMKWWHGRSKNGESASNANNCLITVLNCLDYECVSCKDINIMKNMARNSFVTNVLNGFLGKKANLSPDVRAAVNTLKQDRKRRDPKIRPCVMSMDEDEHFDISFYDKDEKAMRKYINVQLHDNERRHELQEHMGVFSYKENILCFGQSKQDGQITSVWMYNTLKENWQHVTRFPQVRTISDSCILNDKLFIIGTSDSKSKINDMMYYDFTKDEWTTNIKLPKFEFEITCCEFQKKLFVMFDKHRKADRNTGYFYIPETRRWQRVNIQDKNELIWEPWDTFFMFSDKNRLYVQGFTMDKYLIEMVLVKGVLEVKSCKEFEPLQCDDCEFFKSGRHLYIFSNTDDKCDKKYDNDDYSDGTDYFDDLDNYDMTYYDMNYYDMNYYGELYDYSDDDRKYYDTLSRYCLTDNTTDLLLADKLRKENWMPDVACFGLFHYSIVSRDTRVSKFAH